MRKLRFTWPLYLGLTFGVVAAVDLVFDVLGLGKTTIGGIVFFSLSLIVLDALAGDMPSQRRGEKTH